MNDLSIYSGENKDRYTEFCELLFKRDQLSKEAGSLMLQFTKEFGEKITANFELKIECIKKKKMIAFCQKSINQGVCIDTTAMDIAIEEEMAGYYYELKQMIQENKSAKEAKDIDEYSWQRAKKIYRRLTKKLHPDINRMTEENPELQELWDRIVKAYKVSDVEELENLEALVERVMTGLGEKGFQVEFSDIEDRIAKLERQIGEILSTEPYIYKDILMDEEERQKKHEQLDAEHEEYKKYSEQLSATLDEMIRNGGVSIKWEMN